VDSAKSLVKLRTFIEISLKCTAKERGDNFLTEQQWEQVEVFLDVFRPLRRATDKLQAKELKLGDFYAVWSEAKLALLQKAEKGSALAGELVEAMEERAKSVQYKRRNAAERLPPLFHYPSFYAALFLDPRFVAILSAEQAADAL
jgi:hypothetical protein